MTLGPAIGSVKTRDITRSGRYYILEEFDRLSRLRNNGVNKAIKEKGLVQALPMKNKLVSKKEASEFLKVMKHSDYVMMEQLKKIPFRITILSLNLTSVSHH